MAKQRSARRLPTGMTYEEACHCAGPELGGIDMLYEGRIYTLAKAEITTGPLGDWVRFTLRDTAGESLEGIHHSAVSHAPAHQGPRHPLPHQVAGVASF